MVQYFFKTKYPTIVHTHTKPIHKQDTSKNGIIIKFSKIICINKIIIHRQNCTVLKFLHDKNYFPSHTYLTCNIFFMHKSAVNMI